MSPSEETGKIPIDVPPGLVAAFTLMWATYPAPASLAHKSRTVIAVNEPCRQSGREPGMNCAKWGPPEQHPGCLAHRALRGHKGLYRGSRSGGGVDRPYRLRIPRP